MELQKHKAVLNIYFFNQERHKRFYRQKARSDLEQSTEEREGEHKEFSNWEASQGNIGFWG